MRIMGTPRSPYGRPDRSNWRRYSDEKAAWLRAHPNATGNEIEAAAHRIAAKLGL